jgi:hypothetical protein
MPLNPNDQSGNYYQSNGTGTTWLRPGGAGGSTTWMYGANAPTAGVDARAWNNVSNPLAFEYGGERGGAGTEQRRYANMGLAAQARTGPQADMGAYNISMNAEDRSRDAQQLSLDQLQDQIAGRGPSVAQSQMNAGLAAGMRGQLQMAASARGGGAGLVAAQQSAAAQNNLTSSQAIFQGANLRSQEQMAAQQQFGQQATQMRAADLQRAGMSAQNAFQQAQLEAGQRGQNQQAQLAYEAMRQGVFQQQMQGQMQGEAQNSGAGLSYAQMQAQKDAANNAFWRQLVGGTITAAGTVGGAMIGGPAGAMAGGAAGNALGGAVAGGGGGGGMFGG